MLERTNFVRDVNKNYDVSIPSELKPYFERGDHYRVYHDAESGAIAYVPNIFSYEEKFKKNLSSFGSESQRNKYILRHDYCGETYLSLTKEQVDLFDWLRNTQIIDTEYELIPVNENVKWLNI